jgi:hypothetical protein
MEEQTCAICGKDLVEHHHRNLRCPGLQSIYSAGAPKPRPTIAELEAVLNSEEKMDVTILPDGQVRAIPSSRAPTQFEREIAEVINRHSRENGSDTPDFILAAYLVNCLFAFDQAASWRAKWHSQDGVPLNERALGPRLGHRQDASGLIREDATVPNR